MSVITHLARLLAGYREREHRDAEEGWEDPDTDAALRRVLILADNADAGAVIIHANRLQECGQLALPLARGARA